MNAYLSLVSLHVAGARFVQPRATARLLGTMFLLVLAITYLMEAKPW
jgi:hypothetical protein